MTKAVDYRKPFFRRQALHFECTRCGACCSGGPDEHVFLEPDEVPALAAELELSTSSFRRRYLMRTEEGDLVLRMRDDGACILLAADGTCGAYRARPLQCRTYPFWPELVRTAKAWRREARRCEGMDRGERVPIERIEAALREMER
ncbi:MAG: YkgJ family cysteine cluster protein [Gammaproteobacteria bacterium]|nr:YkgJ family cysteine cluster protein [Gammaproteobacteria bacterium]